jgi:hypothetical protein
MPIADAAMGDINEDITGDYTEPMTEGEDAIEPTT